MTKRFGVVDVGSNTIKVTITDYLDDHQFKKVLYKDFPSCLGRNMTEEKKIDENELSGCYSALKEIRKILQENKVRDFKYIATHALREALNQLEILDLIKSNTGVDVKVITGEEEARLTLKAILIDLSVSESYACINAGGGSTELSFHLPQSSIKEQLYFFRFGAVNLFNNYFKHKPNIESAIAEIGELIGKEFVNSVSLPQNIDKVISVGGSIYNAAYISKKDKERNFDKLSGVKLSVEDIESVISQLKSVSEEKKKNIPGLDQARINTILPGLLIHYFLLKLLGKYELVISTRTISDGLIFDMASKSGN